MRSGIGDVKADLGKLFDVRSDFETDAAECAFTIGTALSNQQESNWAPWARHEEEQKQPALGPELALEKAFLANHWECKRDQRCTQISLLALL